MLNPTKLAQYHEEGSEYLNIWIWLKSLELDLFKLLPEPLLHLLLAFLCFRTQEGHILFCQGVATFRIFGMMIGSFQKGTKAILIALFSLCWKYNYYHIQQAIILIFLKTLCDAETYFSNHCLKDCMMLKQTILCSSSEFPPSSSFLVSRHDFKSKWRSENIWENIWISIESIYEMSRHGYAIWCPMYY